MLHRHYIYICSILLHMLHIYRSPMISSEISGQWSRPFRLRKQQGRGGHRSHQSRGHLGSGVGATGPLRSTDSGRMAGNRPGTAGTWDDLGNLEIALLGGPSPSYFLIVEHRKTCPTRFFCTSNGICWPSEKGSTGKMFMETGESLWV